MKAARHPAAGSNAGSQIGLVAGIVLLLLFLLALLFFAALSLGGIAIVSDNLVAEYPS